MRVSDRQRYFTSETRVERAKNNNGKNVRADFYSEKN